MQPAEALCPEEQGSFLDWPTLLHQEHKACWLEEDNYEDHALQSQGNFHIPSNQLCTDAAFPCKSDITELADKEAHLPCPISNTQRNLSVLCSERSDVEDRSWRSPFHAVYSVPKYSLSNLRKSSSVKTVPSGFFFAFFSGGRSLDFLPLFWVRIFKRKEKNNSRC